MFAADLVPESPSYDIVIRSGKIVDGTGAPWYIADIGIRDGRIVKIGGLDPRQARETIDAAGMIVAPGFIDMMGQTATPLMNDPKSAMNLLTQGITTINCGEGVSAAPLSSEQAATQGWRTMREYFQLLDQTGLPVNIVQTVGHTQVRRLVIGEVDRRPTAEELQAMQALVREGMEAGAIGLSSALIYPPATFAQTEELAALAQVAGEFGGRYYTHMRNEGDKLLDAVDEALEIGQSGQVPVHIFHLKAAGRQNWEKMQLAIARIKAARGAGQQVAADIYPYINNGLGIAALIHPRHFAEGHAQLLRKLDSQELRAEIRKEMEQTSGWENWYRHVGQDWGRIVVGQARDSRYAPHVGQSVAAIAANLKEDPWVTFFNLVLCDAFVLPQSMTDANLIRAMQEEFVSFCTDVGPDSGEGLASHPRAYGAFPRMLSRYVRDLGAISLERAIAQASAVAANEVLQYDRGRIAIGLPADIIIFNYTQLTDRATFAEPHALAEGMQHVLVNGVTVLKEGKYTDKRPGRVLRGPGYRAESAPAFQSTGELSSDMKPFDDLMRGFMAEHHVPGGALAVADQGKLVFARGYGYADLETGDLVQPTSLFRIASISKPITAVAILQLVEQGNLQLDDKVFDILDYNSAIASQANFDDRQRQITIRHLLQHRGGWDRDVSFDAMFQSVRFAKEQGEPAPAGPETIIRAMLGVKLDFEPGQRYAYSNYGYCLLGRVIEKISGQDYEQYVREHVLAPLGIQRMRIGRTQLTDRAPNEVRYFAGGKAASVFQESLGKQVPWPYGGWYLEAMDAHGAWIASAVDLSRFAATFSDPESCPLLSAASLQLMRQRPDGLAGHEENGDPKEVYYGLGWSTRVVGADRFNIWHTGSLSGTATILILRHDGKVFAAVFNSRSGPSGEHLGRAIDPLLHKAADEVRSWDVTDQFTELLGD